MEIKDEQLEQLLRALDAEEELPFFPGQTENCLSFPRFFDLVLHPSRMTIAEKTHLKDCGWCQKHMQTAKRDAWHPSLFSDWEEIRSHSEDHGCERLGCRGIQFLRSRYSEIRPEWMNGPFAFALVAPAAERPLAFGPANESAEIDMEPEDPRVNRSKFPNGPLVSGLPGSPQARLWVEGESLRLSVDAPVEFVGSRVRVDIGTPNGAIFREMTLGGEQGGRAYAVVPNIDYPGPIQSGEWGMMPPVIIDRK